MIKFHDYNPDKPFKVTGEFHYISDGKIFLDYTPKQGTMVAIMDGKALTESATDSPKAGEFYIDYAVASEYKQATQVVLFNEADNGKRVDFDYEGVSTIIKAEHMNEIRDFMNRYDEDRATDLVAGTRPPRKGELVETLSNPQLTDFTEVAVVGVVGNMISVESADGIEEGKTYTITDGTKYEEFEVESVNTTDGVVTAKNLAGSYESGKIIATTATMVNGEAIVAGETQIVKWGKKEIWKGNKGTVESTATLYTDGATLSDMSQNPSGELEVADAKKSSLKVMLFGKPTNNNSFPLITSNRTYLMDDGIMGAIWQDNAATPCLRCFENGDIMPFCPVETANTRQKPLTSAPTRSATSYYVPPLWAKEIEVERNGVKRKLVSFSKRAAEGYSLLPVFQKHPDGFCLIQIPQSYSSFDTIKKEVSGAFATGDESDHISTLDMLHASCVWMLYTYNGTNISAPCYYEPNTRKVYKPNPNALVSATAKNDLVVAGDLGDINQYSTVGFDISTGMFTYSGNLFYKQNNVWNIPLQLLSCRQFGTVAPFSSTWGTGNRIFAGYYFTTKEAVKDWTLV